MRSDPHARARFLIDEELTSPIEPGDERWLRKHLAECAECANCAELTSRMVRGFHAISFEPEAAMTARVQKALAAGIQPRRLGAPAWRWGLAAAALLIATAPIYKSFSEKRREAEVDKADTLLLERVNARLSQSLPEAMEPLTQPPQPEGRVR